MLHWRKLCGSEHLESADIPDGGKAMITIRHVGSTTLDGPTGKQKKLLFSFDPSPTFARTCEKRTWVAPSTVGRCLEAMFGKDANAWIGKRIVLHVETVEAFGDEAEAVRIYGSPDIAAPVTVTVPKGKKKQRVRLEAVTLPTRAPTSAPESATDDAPATAQKD